MAHSRNVIVAGAGIGGLTAALALANRGFRVALFEQAARLEEAGAGIQLSPNASRVLIALGLGEALQARAIVPQAMSVRTAPRGEEIIHMPLGSDMAFRYGAPYWMTHRADLQAVLLDAVRAHPDIVLELGARVEDFAIHGHGVTVHVRQGVNARQERGIALIAADGLWSSLRAQLGHSAPPHFARRVAWRALVPAASLREPFRAPVIHLWLGAHAHLVHYPVRAGSLVNIVAIVRDSWHGAEWSAPGKAADIVERFNPHGWPHAVREVVAAPATWQKWALHDRMTLRRWGRGPVTLLGDAIHPALPFLAQGAAMAIEDAACLAASLAAAPGDVPGALRAYENMRRFRTASVQRAARGAGRNYHLAGPLAWARDVVLRGMGGDVLRARYDWLYDWRGA